MMKRGQGAFEYILMLSGVLLIVILIIFILQGTLAGTGNQLNTQANSFGNTVTTDYVAPYTQCLVVTGTTPGITAVPGFPCCMLNGAANIAACSATCPATMPVCTSGTGMNCPSGRFDRKAGRCA
ncbi:MAG: class III signal peptide-containing protein [Candidatus Micrarchaeia archaeon]|jgi:uncharacterized protein (UPF0333 family)